MGKQSIYGTKNEIEMTHNLYYTQKEDQNINSQNKNVGGYTRKILLPFSLLSPPLLGASRNSIQKSSL